MLRQLFDRAATPILVVCCLIVTGLSVRAQLFPPTAQLPSAPSTPLTGHPLPATLSREPGLRIGSKNAALNIVEFADFECPFCAVSATEIRELRKKYPNDVAVTFRHLIIPGHANSPEAALSAECAAEQGAFEEYYELLFANHSRLGKRNWRELAKQAGVQDLSAFDGCVRSSKYASHIAADTNAARAIGLRGTPSWIVRDSVFGGIPPMSQFDAWVQDAIRLGAQHATGPSR